MVGIVPLVAAERERVGVLLVGVVADFLGEGPVGFVELRELGVALEFGVDDGEVEGVGQGQGVAVGLFAAADEDVGGWWLVIGGWFGGELDGGLDVVGAFDVVGDFRVVGVLGEDYVTAVGQGF